MMFFADMGLPMIQVIWPAAWIALIPVILIEAAIGRRVMKTTFPRATCAATAANLFSTLLGIPLTWIALATLEGLGFSTAEGLDTPARVLYAVTVQSPWLIPYEDALRWMVPVATVVLCVPLWLMSAATEYVIARRFFPKAERSALWRWMLLGNAASYAFLLLLLLLIAIPFFWSCVRWVYVGLGPAIDFVIEAVFTLVHALRGPPGGP
jgi:hypothetical protein